MTAADEIERPKPERVWPGILLVIVLMLLLLLYDQPESAFLSTDQGILHWYAMQLHSGHGMVFNPGQPILLIASPLYILVWAGVQILLPEHFFLAVLLFQTLGANSLFRIARRTGLSYNASSLAGLLYLLMLWSGIGTAIPLMTSLSLLALDLTLAGRWRLAGLTFAAAVLCHPEALLLALLVLVFTANRGAGRRFGLALGIPLLTVVLGLSLYYGSSLWAGLLLLKPDVTQPLTLLFELSPYILLAVPGIWGWYKQRNNPIVALLGAWAASSLFISSVLLRLPAYAEMPAASAIVLLALVGLSEFKGLRQRLGYVLVIGIGLASIIVSLTVSSSSYQQNSDLRRTDITASTVGTPSTVWALLVRASPDQTMISFDGQLQPDLKAMIERGDIQSALIRYAPDVLLTDTSGRVQPKMLSAGAWARLDYQLDQEPGLYRRASPIGAFVDQPVSVPYPYGPDIRLTGMALDQSTLSPGQLLRVRLDWDYGRSASTPVTVELRLESGEYVLAYAQDTYEPSIFRAGQWGTYHTLTVDPQAWAGPVTLTVGVIINGGTAGRVSVATLPITAR